MRHIKEYVTITAVIAIGMVILIGIVLILRGVGTPPGIGEQRLPEMDEADPGENANDVGMTGREVINLPDVDRADGLSVEAALERRRSTRTFSEDSLTIGQISQLLWAAQGITDEGTGFRAAPSAGATYPLEVYVLSAGVTNLEHGLYRYEPTRHQLRRQSGEDLREEVYASALRQAPIREAPVLLVITGVYERTTSRYGERGVRYVHMEAGHAAQNLYLQTESLGLGMVVIGAFDDQSIADVLQLSEGETPLYLIPVGHPDR